MKNYSIDTCIEVLERTPKSLHAMLSGLSDEWVMQDEGPGTWSVFDVLSHLVFCEQKNFFNRIHFIRSNEVQQKIPPFDMSVQFESSKGKNINHVLEEFGIMREQNLTNLQKHPISEAELSKTGIHQKIGIVTLRNVLSTWVAHDLAHTVQIARVIAKQYKLEVGPFIEFLPILH